MRVRGVVRRKSRHELRPVMRDVRGLILVPFSVLRRLLEACLSQPWRRLVILRGGREELHGELGWVHLELCEE